MLGLLLLASALGAPDTVARITVRVSNAQSDYRNCIADTIAGRPDEESSDLALAAALEACRDAELALRQESRDDGGNKAADTLGLVLDTRLEGQEEGLKRRPPR